ncbi:hypothetical protein ACIHFC_09760 [Streptomyces sp. NPDC052013]|uniref:hypothetical protein n=1 Tax=Streptomyces sp. NPDC052013 TaxID=3365679 RepID=UPI0037D2EF99
MSETTSAEAAEPDETSDPAPLSVWSRVVAGTLGFTLCSAGAIAVFRTQNQAGCVALILAGSLFVILTIGGNPLHSLGFGEAQMRFAVQKRRREAIESISDAPPEEARRALDVLQAIDPGVTSDASFRYQSARTYEELARQRFLQLFPDCAVGGRSADVARNIDFLVHRPDGRVIGVDALCVERESALLPMAMISKRIDRATQSVVPTLIMSNAVPSPPGQQLLERARAEGAKIRYVFWRDERDDSALQAAAGELFGQPT